MDVIVVINGLGNQMSQYSFYLQKKKSNSESSLITFCKDHNGFELNKVFNINYVASFKENFLYILFRILIAEKGGASIKVLKKFLNFFGIKITRENYNYNFQEKYLNVSKGINFYLGGWHTEKYFKSVSEKIKMAFIFQIPSDKLNQQIIEDINTTNSISVHIRRGDFLNKDNINLFGQVCSRAYYEMAIKRIEKKIDNSHFFVFSNDMDWVKQNLVMKNVSYVNCNTGQNSWKDMYLMTICKHNIIANSTFSWWGAWLNKNKNKIVICPHRFLNNDTYTDIYPDSWVKISDY